MDKILEKWDGYVTWSGGFMDDISEDPLKYFDNIGLIAAVIIGAILVILSIGLIVKILKRNHNEKSLVHLKVLVKKTTDTKKTEELITNLHSTILNTNLRSMIYGDPYMGYEIFAEEDHVTFYLLVPKIYKDFLTERVYASYQDCSITEVEDYLPEKVESLMLMRLTMPVRFLIWSIKKLRGKTDKKFIKTKASAFGTEMELYSHHIFPLKKDVASEDIIGSLLSGTKNLEWHEKVIVQVLAKPVNGNWQTFGRKVMEKYVQDHIRPRRQGRSFTLLKPGEWEETKESLADEFREFVDAEKEYMGMKTSNAGNKRQSNRKTPLDRKEITGATEKLMQHGFETVIRVAVIGNHRGKAKNRLKMLGGSFNELDKENKLTRRIIYNKTLLYKRLKKRRMYLNGRDNILVASELSKFFMRLPGEELVEEHPTIEALTVKELPPPRQMAKEGLVLGSNTYRGITTDIVMGWKDFARHIVLQGKTGTGKSELGKTWMRRLAEMGCGFALIEPHGKLATEVLQIIPANRKKDVIIFDTLADYVPAMNICSVPKGIRNYEAEKEKVAKEVIKIFSTQFSEAWSGKNASYLENAIKTVIELPGGTMVDIRRLFNDHKFREYVIPQLKDPNLRMFWENEFAMIKGRLNQTAQATVSSLDYKLSTFLNSENLKRAIGQPENFDFKKLMDQNKILIFRLNKKDMSEETVSFIGSMAVSNMINAAFRRDLNKSSLPYPIFMDEAQNFLTPDIKTAMEEIRKYFVPMVIMHQALYQLEEVKGLKEAIYGNVGTKISMTTGKDDAKFYVKEFDSTRIDETDMKKLPSRYAYATIMNNGKSSDVFNLYSLDSPQIDPKAGPKQLKELVDLNKVGRRSKKEIDEIIYERQVGDVSFIEKQVYDEIESDVDIHSEEAQSWDAYHAAENRPIPEMPATEMALKDVLEDGEDTKVPEELKKGPVSFLDMMSAEEKTAYEDVNGEIDETAAEVDEEYDQLQQSEDYEVDEEPYDPFSDPEFKPDPVIQPDLTAEQTTEHDQTAADQEDDDEYHIVEHDPDDDYEDVQTEEVNSPWGF